MDRIKVLRYPAYKEEYNNEQAAAVLIAITKVVGRWDHNDRSWDQIHRLIKWNGIPAAKIDEVMRAVNALGFNGRTTKYGPPPCDEDGWAKITLRISGAIMAAATVKAGKPILGRAE